MSTRNRKIQTTLLHLRRRYVTVQTGVVVAAALIALSWIWGALDMMQRNYALQQQIDLKRRELQLAELQRDNLALQNQYYETTEYQELAVRESLGEVRPGEHVLVLPENTAAQDDNAVGAASLLSESSNLEQWVNFLFGGYSRSINEE